MDPAAVLRVQQAHAAVERLASGLEDARRGERKAAGQRVSDAVEAERVALSELGFESYATFLLAMAEGRGQNDAAHDEAALMTAEAALARAHDREQVFVLLSERELDLRARVARLLGRLPGPDVGTELRGGLTETPATVARDRLEAALRSASIPVGDDAVVAAERYLQSGQSRRARSSTLRAELEEIESEGTRLDDQLDLAENELAAAERDLIASVGGGTLAGREAPVTLATAEPGELSEAIERARRTVGSAGRRRGVLRRAERGGA